MTEGFEDLEVREAGSADIDVVLSILEGVARWLLCRGIEEWTPGSFSLQRIAERIERGEMYLTEEPSHSNGRTKRPGAGPRMTPVTSTGLRSAGTSPAGVWDSSFSGGRKTWRLPPERSIFASIA